MNALNDILIYIDGFIGSAFWFPYLLLGTGLFFTIYLKFPQIIYFKRAWQILSGKHHSSDAEGDTTHYRALTTALSGTVGTGNIGGVGLAIFLGGPAALFWMWATAFLGMTTKFVEVTLSHKYRVKTEDGTMAGGPMYYMDRKLNMKPLAILFAIACVVSSFGSGSLPQINNMAQSVEASFNIKPIWTGAVGAILMGLVIIGGIKRIAAFTSKVVPVMAGLYLIGAASVIFANLGNIGPAFMSILKDAFNGSAATGGFLGATFAYAFNKGVARGLYSNEAGQGSAPIAHASAKTKEPISEGMVSLLEPFIDTLLICTITGLVIISSGVWTEKYENNFQSSDMTFIQGNYTEDNQEQRTNLYHLLNETGESTVVNYNGSLNIVDGNAIESDFTIINSRSIAEEIRFNVNDQAFASEQPFTGLIKIEDGKLQTDGVQVRGKSLIHSASLTTKAFTKGFFGESGKYIVTICLLLFAFSTAVAWSYYGDRAITYLFGVNAITPYRIVYVIAFFLASFSDTTLIWNFALITVAVMTIPNLFAILLLRKDMKQTVNEYFDKVKS